MEGIKQQKESINRKQRKNGPWWNPLDFFELLPLSYAIEEDDHDSDFDVNYISDSNSDDYVKINKTKKVYAPTVENVNHDDSDDDDNSLVSSQSQTQAAQQFTKMADVESVMEKQDQGAIAGVAQEEEEEVDETGVEPYNNIDFVMIQAGVSKSKALKALKTHNGDIVGAIMELTMEEEEAEEEEEVDETGVDPRDIDLVMTQAGVSKSKAVKALKTHIGDIVAAIMKLTMEEEEEEEEEDEEDEEEEEVDATGVDRHDIDLVRTQAGVSKSKAVKALKTHNGDIVAAIMELTS
ncbi:hypothetical protein TSUD_412150 [Trifolium subterraneum]|uniref:Nascent polypeptide-associated complex subunit alpha-like UBA domain-containing protein n=1 Tax=Trifolium subterraneum TaxID=3900 RepID=A0A2Z6PTW8_TRISU|nr:hypothetical protein TSUD_412150 [Trifolium subterraneum]